MAVLYKPARQREWVNRKKGQRCHRERILNHPWARYKRRVTSPPPDTRTTHTQKDNHSKEKLNCCSVKYSESKVEKTKRGKLIIIIKEVARRGRERVQNCGVDVLLFSKNDSPFSPLHRFCKRRFAVCCRIEGNTKQRNRGKVRACWVQSGATTSQKNK